jgi:uncharacterized protein (TIGR03085 family)
LNATVTGIAARERASLVDLLTELGPDAPTLCDGWDTRHLAAHLVTRERKPTAVAGIVVPAFAGHTARLETETLAHHTYADLVGLVRTGPPIGPVSLPGTTELVNVHEFFVHHEDVRRAQTGWAPRSLPNGYADALRRRLVVLAPMLFGRLHGVRLHLDTPQGRVRTVGRGPEEVTVRGEVPELFLYAFGRRGAADVEVSGSTLGRERLAAADLRR